MTVDLTPTFAVGDNVIYTKRDIKMSGPYAKALITKKLNAKVTEILEDKYGAHYARYRLIDEKGKMHIALQDEIVEIR